MESNIKIDEILLKYFDTPINEYETMRSNLRKTRENRDENCNKLEEINDRCIDLIKEIEAKIKS